MREMTGPVAIVLGLAAIALFGSIIASDNSVTTWIAAAKYYAEQACEPCYQVARKLHSAVLVPNQLLSWHFYALVGIISLLEWIRPAYTRSRVFAASFFHDSLWFLVDALLIPVFYRARFGFHHSYLGFLQVDMVRAWPLAAHIVVAVLAADFIRWFHHLLCHKVILFWYFHAVHHSQRDMNLFTDFGNRDRCEKTRRIGALTAVGQNLQKPINRIEITAPVGILSL